MNKSIIGVIIIVAVLGIPGFASAENGQSPRSPDSFRKSVRERIGDLRDGLKAQIELRKQEPEETVRERIQNVRTRVSERNRQRVKNFWENMAGRLEVLIKNQIRLADRVSLRLDDAERKGKDVTAVRKQLDDARSRIHLAQNALSDSQGAVDRILNDSGHQEALTQVKELNKEILEKIKEAHRALAVVVSGLKGISSSAAR